MRVLTAVILSVFHLFSAAGVCAAAAADGADSPAARAAEIFEATGVRGGLVVHLGCGDGRLTAALYAHDGFLVQGWDTDLDKLAAAHRHICSLECYGPVSVSLWSGNRLPYIDNLANLIVVSGPSPVTREELMRVLRPEGVAVFLAADGEQRTMEPLVKPRPDTISDWTHYLYDASGNAVAADREVGPPRRLQWLGSPRYGRHHDRMSSVSAVVSAGGRVFAISDEASRFSILLPARWQLIARDAFNGTILWKRDIATWYSHLWPLKSGPAQLPRRLVAGGDRVYATLGLGQPVEALDAATGETVHTYQGTAGAEEILLADGVLYALVNPRAAEAPDDGWEHFQRGYKARIWDEEPREVVALNAGTGQLLWSERRRVLPGTLAVAGDRVAFHDGESVVCLERRGGREQWRSQPVPRSAEILGFYLPTLVLYEDVVLFSGGETAGTQTGSWYRDGEDTLTALAAQDGRVLWKAHHPPSGYRSPEDVLVVNGLVWTGETTSGRAEGIFTGRDLRTGEVKAEFPPDVSTYWFHHRCYRGKAAGDYLLMSRTGVEFIDIRRQTWEAHHWVRGACLYGVMPANGLLYAPQHPCACYLEAKLDGFSALAPASGTVDARRKAPASERLDKGPAFGFQAPDSQTPAPGIQNPKSKIGNPSDWPTYRHDATRSGRASTTVPADVQIAWQAEIGGRLSSPVIADGLVFVAAVDAHTVHALDAASGRQLWQFTASGRVDSPPTIHRGLALFGSADGYVYALRAKDGEMVWRFRAAPRDERLVAFEQIESVWPVHGSVLVQDGVLYFVAGRSMFLDGGLRLWRLEPETGRVLSETVLDQNDPAAGRQLQDYVSWLNMPPALPDILSSDGRYVYMRSQPFGLDGERLPLAAQPAGEDADRGAMPPVQDPELAHLFSPTGFLDDEGWHRSYWLYGSRFVSGWAGYYLAGQTAPAGKILVFDEDKVYGFGRKPQYFRWTTPLEHHLFAADKFAPATPKEDRRSPRETRVRVAKSPGLRPAGQPLAVAAWVKATKPDGVVLARGGGALGYVLYLQGGRPHFGVRAQSELTVAAAEQRAAGRWVHLAGVLTGDAEVQLYVDGSLAASAQAPGLIPGDPQEAMEIGADDGSTVGPYSGPFAFDGVIDEVRIYRGDLSGKEVTALADPAGDATPKDARLILYYSFDDGSAKDLSGSGHDGVVEGAEPVEGKVGRGLRFVGGPPRVPGYNVVLHWTEDQPLWARALVLADGVLFAAGPPDLVDEERAFREIRLPTTQEQLAGQAEAFAGRRGGLLRAVSAADGRLLGERALESPPVFDGMAAANGRLYMTTMAGQVVCLGPDR